MHKDFGTGVVGGYPVRIEPSYAHIYQNKHVDIKRTYRFGTVSRKTPPVSKVYRH